MTMSESPSWTRPVRIAMVCDHPECDPRARRFFFSEEEARGWKCPDHHSAVRQVNKPYVRPVVAD